MKKILSYAFIFVLALASLTLVSCKKNKGPNAQEAIDALVLEQGTYVEGDFFVPGVMTIEGTNYALKWTSNNACLAVAESADEQGEYKISVTRPETEVQTVILTATLDVAKKNSGSKDFEFTVWPITLTDVFDNFTFAQDGAKVSTNFELPLTTTYNGKTANIAWASNNELVKVEGNQAIVAYSAKDVVVELTATFTLAGFEAVEFTYTVTVSAPQTNYEQLVGFYSNDGNAYTLSGYVTEIATAYDAGYGNVSLYIINDDFTGGYYLYRVLVSADEAAQIALGAHVTVTGAKATMYNGLIETAEKTGTLVVDEEIAPINVDEHIYALDQDVAANLVDSYYHIGCKGSLTGWKVEEVTPIDVNGSSTQTVLKISKEGVTLKIAYSKYIASTPLKDAENENYKAIVAKLATLKAGDYVNVTGIVNYYDSNKEGYKPTGLQLFLQNADSIKVVEAPAEGALNDAKAVAAAIAKAPKFQAMYAGNAEVTLPADIDGVAVVWAFHNPVHNGVEIKDGKLVVAPASYCKISVEATYTKGSYSATVYYAFEVESLSDAELVEKALEEVEIEDIQASGNVTLPATNDVYGVTFAYALKGTPSSVTLKDGVLTVDNTKLTADEKVTIVVTATKGEASEELEVEITVYKLTAVTISQFIKNANTSAPSLLHGYVTAVASSSGAGSFILTDAEGNSIFCYDKDLDVKLGDEIKVLAVYSSYQGFHQMAKPVLFEKVSEGNDYVAKSGTPVNVTAAELATAITTGTNADLIKNYTGKYLAVKGYVIQVGSNYALAATADGTMVVNIYANSTINLSGEIGKEITLYGFSRGVKSGAEGNITIQTQKFEGKPLTDAEKVAADKAALTLVEETLVDLTLPTEGSVHKSTITWATNNEAVITAAGKVTRPAAGAEDATVKLTATIKVGEATDTKEFTVLVKAEALDPNVDLVAKDKAALELVTETFEDLELPTEGANGSTITWASNNEAVISAAGKLTFPKADTTVKLTATINKGEVTETKEFEVKVMALLTVAEFIKAADTSNVKLLHGYVVAVNGIGEANSFVLADAEGTSIFCYDKLIEVALGDEILVKAKYSSYNGFHQMAGPELVKTISEENDVTTKSGKLVQYTVEEAKTAITAAADDAALVAEFGQKYLEITGYAIEYTTSKGTFVGINATGTGSDYVVSLYANKDLKTSDYLGKEVILLCFVRGVSSKYDNITVQVQSIRENVLSDAEIVAADKLALSVVGETTENLTLPTTGAKGSTITWASSNTAVIANDGKVTRPAVGAEDATVTLTATITKGEATETKTFTVVVAATPADLDQEAVDAVAAALTVPTTTKENLTLKTSENGTTITWISSDATIITNAGVVTRGEEDREVTLTATVTLNGKTATNSFTVKVLAEEKVVVSTIAEALAAAEGTVMTVRGVVSEVSYKWSSTNKNMSVYISDGLNTIYLFKHYTQVNLGDVVTVTGTIAVYNKVNQFGEGSTSVIETTLLDSDKVSIDTLAINLGDLNAVTEDLTLPTTGSQGSTITWTSSDAAISTTGVVTRGAADTIVTLTATIVKGSAKIVKTFKATVLAEGAAQLQTAKISFSDKANRTVYTTDQQVWVQNGVTVTNNKGASTSNVGDYSNPARFYKTSDLIISFTSNISKIVVECNTAAYATSLGKSVTGSVVDGLNVTITLDTAATSFTCTLTDGQVRVNSITIYYAE